MISPVKLAGIAGWPVAHSLSPLLHNHWLRELRMAGAYVPLAIKRDDFFFAVDGLRRAGFVGLNVTIPHKEAAFALSQQLDEPARLSGAVNLLCFQRGERIVGSNTDVEGLFASLTEEFGPDTIRGKVVVVLGTGGGARAATLALAQLGVKEIRFIARDPNTRSALIFQLRPHVKALLVGNNWSEWSRAVRDAALLVNATPAGMIGKPPLDLPLDPLPDDALIYDLVYNPLETDLVKRARARGLGAANGLGMLMHQAVPAFKDLFGATPQITPALRETLEKGLRQ